MHRYEETLRYPATRIETDIDILAGVEFPDSYRWLEGETDEVKRWQEAQTSLASCYARDWSHFQRLRNLVSKFNTERYVALPKYAGGRWFHTRIPPGSSHAQVIAGDQPMGSGQVIFDPETINCDRRPFVSWISPAPDGRTLAVGLCFDGSENNTIRLIDVSSGRLLADPPEQMLMDNFVGGVQWLPNSSGFFFSALTSSAAEFDQQVFLHLRGSRSRTILVDIPWVTAKDYRMVVVSRDGGYAVAIERLMNPIPVAIAPLNDEPLQWRPFIRTIEGTLAGHIVGNRYIAITDVGAPRGRLVAIPIDAREPNSSSNWEELVAESNAALRTVSVVGDVLYVSEFVDSYMRVRIFDLYGNKIGEVPLPGKGAICEQPFSMMNLVQRGHPAKFLFAFSSLTVSPAIYSHAPNQDRIELVQEPHARLENTVVEDHWALSRDGTRVPYHLVRRSDISTRGPIGTLIYAYGGFNAPLSPQFPGPMAAFVAMGGVFVHAHLRGGAEFGRSWWEGGRMRQKQRCYDDLYAVAEDLIAAGVCTQQCLAVTGRSNGGLMAGVAATQRPDLWKVVVPRVPLLDLIGACREPYGRLAVTLEYANVEDPEEVHRLATFSPYHLVRDGTNYPAMFIDAGNTDPRCPPWHARKFAARLQRASCGSAPILLRVWDDVGHGLATPKGVEVNQQSEWLAFTLRHVGLGCGFSESI